MLGGLLQDEIVTLEPAGEHSVDLLVQWTLDPVAQGPYKRVPPMTAEELRALVLHSSDRWYFLIRRTADRKPLGRFYYRARESSHDTYNGVESNDNGVCDHHLPL